MCHFCSDSFLCSSLTLTVIPNIAFALTPTPVVTPTLTPLSLSFYSHPFPYSPSYPSLIRIPPFSSPSLLLFFSFTQPSLLPLFSRLPCPSPILAPTPTLIHALTITLTLNPLQTQTPMPFVMAWTPGTSTHIFRLEKTHPLFAQDGSIALSISTGYLL